MRDSFWEYYPRSDEATAALSKDGLIVLDASALLHSYRLMPTTAESWLSMLEALADRLWVPHQAALEYQRNRIRVIAGQSSLITSIDAAVHKSFEELRAAVAKKRSDINRSRVLDHGDLTKAIDASLELISPVVAEARDRQTDLSGAMAASDDVHQRLTKLLTGRVGSAPDDSTLECIFKEGKKRYAAKQPPGFEDIKKDSHPEDPYGDLIIWKQMLDKAKEDDRPAVFVTEELKEDWWRKEAGQLLGPLPALRREFSEHAGHEFWLYSVAGIMRASSHFGHDIDTEAIQDAESLEAEAEAEAVGPAGGPRLEDLLTALEAFSDPEQFDEDQLRNAIGELLGDWITRTVRQQRKPLTGPAVPQNPSE